MIQDGDKDKDISGKKSKTSSADHASTQLASDDSGQQKKRVSFKSAKNQELKAQREEKINEQDVNARNQNQVDHGDVINANAFEEKEHSPSKIMACTGLKKKDRYTEEENEIEEWERGNLLKDKRDKDKSSKTKKKEKKERKMREKQLAEEVKKKKKAHKKATKEDNPAEQGVSRSAFGAIVIPEARKPRERRFHSIQIGESAPAAKAEKGKSKPVSMSTIAVPLLERPRGLRNSKDSTFDSLPEDLVMRIFMILDLKSLGALLDA